MSLECFRRWTDTRSSAESFSRRGTGAGSSTKDDSDAEGDEPPRSKRYGIALNSCLTPRRVPRHPLESRRSSCSAILVHFLEDSFVHINLIAHDWRHLPGPTGKALPASTFGFLASATTALRWRSSIIPRSLSAQSPFLNQLGLGHFDFAVDEVRGACEEVLDAGGQMVGEVVETHLEGQGNLAFATVLGSEATSSSYSGGADRVDGDHKSDGRG